MTKNEPSLSMIPVSFYLFVKFISCCHRDAPEATGDEPEDADFDSPKIYEAAESFEVLEERLQMFMAQYNESVRGAGMDLVFFKDAMVHLVKVGMNRLTH